MRARSALGAMHIVGIGVVSAATVFVLHRAFISDSPTPLGSGRSASSLDSPAAFGAIEEPLAAPTAQGEQELLAQADPAANESEAEPPAERQRAPEARTRGVPNPHIEALRNPSPIYRNVSLTAVIREAGYVCTDILSSAAGDDGLATWRVSCEDARAYLISEDGVGGLQVEPIAYFESPVVQPIERFVPEPLNVPPRLLPAPR